MSEQPVAQDTLITLTADIVAAHVSNNSVSVGDLPQLIANVHQALTGLDTNEPETPKLEPAVSIRASVKPDYIICLEDGKKLKMLKRHLMTHYQMTPADYRAKWSLPSDYPMVAPSYAATRKELAHRIGLGRKPKAAAPAAKAPATRTRKAKAEPELA
ncbi:MucR family transcriptional regulator [Sphingobium lactosutens]|uniref:MucR family transcriptional regulator n=1 Tax=Sphingobium lactosutens TaxID=522773 RepID=UPI0015B87629|nr:MucR family transcriptional regulator [Sphingobium lactosutens]NWK94875.1 MucR family transcriptional regulator [Sphingobium lactosutens]